MRDLLVALAALGLSSCGELVQTCTLIGCQNALTLNVVDGQGVSADSFHGSVVDARGETVNFTCPQTDGSGRYFCQDGRLQIFGMSAEREQRTTLEVTIGAEGAEAVTVAVEPAYTSREINGPGCGFCFASTATVTVD